jgi:SAM-dependent methyltransferase
MNRSESERRLYDSGGIDRSSYESIFQRSIIDTGYLSGIIFKHMTHAEGKEVLELGSNAWIGYLQNIRPKQLHCVNISKRELNIGIQHCKNNNISFPVKFYLMDANNPSFRDGQFDFIFGGAILHHLDIELAIKNIFNLIKPNGRILFHEPLGANPIAKTVRMLTPFARTRGERPISMKNIHLIGEYFNCTNYFCGFTSTLTAIATRLIAKRSNTLVDRWANSVDKIMSQIRIFSYFYREVIITGSKRPEKCVL